MDRLVKTTPGARISPEGHPALAVGPRRGLRPLTLAVVAAAFAFAVPPAAAASCDKTAATTGSDSAAGTEAQPYRTAKVLVESLTAGQTGCLRAGTYAEDVKVSRGGTAGAPITVTSYPGERARLVGRLYVAAGADYVTFSNLDLVGTNSRDLPSPTVTANNVTFQGNDVTTNHTAICFDIGSDTYGHAAGTVIEGNRIHNCGRLPATNHEHGIYVEDATGTRITDNVIYDNADRGVQLYPDADHSYVARNVIDGNGEGLLFAGGDEGDGNQVSEHNLVESNIITNAALRYNVESYWQDSVVGQNNVAQRNCVFGGARGNIQSPQVGFVANENLVADPHYVNRAAKDFRLRGDSPCAVLLGGAAAPPAPPPAAPAPASPAQPSPVRCRTRRAKRGKRARRRCTRVALTSRKRTVRRERRLVLRGWVPASDKGLARRAKLQLKRGRRWRTVTATHVRDNGSFTLKIRARSRKLRRGTRRTDNRVILRLRAAVPGIGTSLPLSVRLRR
jgi:parallel beta-helix repeat protein